jgi:hypothetical protein
MSVDLLNKADTLKEKCGLSVPALFLLNKLAWKAENYGSFRYPDATFKHCRDAFAKTTYIIALRRSLRRRIFFKMA